jgi:hypothetical protein
MAAIANSTASAATVSLLQTNTAGSASSGSATRPAAANASGSGAADVVQLSDKAQATLAKAKADQAATANLTLSFDEILAQRTDALTQTLTDAFAKLNVNLDDAVRLQVDNFGNVTTEGPWKKKIEKLFQDRPDLAKELKEIAGLNSLKAAQTALDLYNKEKGSTLGSKQQSAAWTQYSIRSINIQTLSDVITLKDGKLRSAAVDYIDMIADPSGAGAAKSQSDPATARRDVADRLA